MPNDFDWFDLAVAIAYGGREVSASTSPALGGSANAGKLPDISLEEQHRLEEIDAERESLAAGRDPEPTYGVRL